MDNLKIATPASEQDMKLSESPSPQRILGKNTGLLLVLCAVLLSGVMIWMDSNQRYGVIKVTLTDGLGPPLPAISQDSESGFEGGMRRLILPAVGADGYQWLMHAQRLVKQGGWRIRHTDNDNAPQGREIHWSQSFIWWLMITGKVHSLLTGLPLPASMEAVTPFANTMFLLPILLILPLLVFRTFGTAAGVVMALGFFAIYLLYELFILGYPDHHGLAALSAMCCSLFVLLGGAGWVSNHSTPTSTNRPFGSRVVARRWFIASGVAGAFGLWISAATIVPVFAGIGLGALAGWLLPKTGRSQKSELTLEPSLWRLWGTAGALGSLFFYALEYFPNHLDMRLEVNHPLYAIAWFCAGDLLARLGEWRDKDARPWATSSKLAFAALSILGMLLLPLLIKMAPERFFHVSDPFLWALHKDYIHEFRNVFGRLKDLDLQGSLIILNAIPLISLVILRLLFVKSLDRPWKALLLLGLGPALVLTVLGALQVRWLGIADALWLVALAATWGTIASLKNLHTFRLWEKGLMVALMAVVFLPHPVTTAAFLVETAGKKPNIGGGSAFMILVRDTAHTLRRMNGDKPMRVLSGPTTSTWLSFYGGMQSVGTLYWENIEGLKSAASMYSAQTESEALEMLKSRGITHVVIFSIDEFSAPYIRLARGLPMGSEPKDAFADAVLYGYSFPRWVTPIQYAMHDQFKNEWVAILEIKPDQTEAEARLGIGRFLASRGNMAGARQEYLAAVKLDDNLSDAHLELAGMLYLADELMPARIHFGQGLAGKTNEQIAEASFTIASFCQLAGRQRAAIEVLRRGLEADPDAPSTRNLLAWLLATSRDESLRKPEEAVNLAINNFAFIGNSAFTNTLAAAQAASGEFTKAVVSAEAAILVAKEAGEPEATIKRYEERLELYKAGKPYVE